ncbi:hypothetical protein RRG08_044733 [Elysia crispata]|uniref:Uncharacterized protein n=1 Tax=Elysia crispata TaxID=231223 RepID=A0AAE0ZHG7_9GAST|nr:hypothetical protein RRG08_044733 [Elysia crispata]
MCSRRTVEIVNISRVYIKAGLGLEKISQRQSFNSEYHQSGHDDTQGEENAKRNKKISSHITIAVGDLTRGGHTTAWCGTWRRGRPDDQGVEGKVLTNCRVQSYQPNYRYHSFT